MKYAHVLHAFYCEPWHLRPDYWRNFKTILQRAIAGEEVSPVVQKALAPRVGMVDRIEGDREAAVVTMIEGFSAR